MPPYRTHGLLGTLLLQPGPQPRAHLIVSLFPDLPEAAARRRLSDLVWLLRRAVPGLPLVSDAEEIGLPAEVRWLDVEAFRQSAAGADLVEWQAALALYRGELLAGLHDEWVVQEREALFLEHLRLAQRACTELLQRREFHEALALAERMVQAEPYDEPALRLYMHALGALGRRGTALAAYERFVARAAEELGVTPEPATCALAEAVRTAAAEPDPVALPAAGSPADLLRLGQEALARGERATAAECVRRLRVAGDEEQARLLEIDTALFFGEHTRAEALLAGCPNRSAAARARAARLALAQHRAAEAQDAAAEALALARESGDRLAEIEALLVAAEVQRDHGHGVQASRSAEQALNLARSCGAPLHAGKALVGKGYAQNHQGCYAQALTWFHEARALAYEHGLRRVAAEALRGTVVAHTHCGALLAALAATQEELSLWRDLGLPAEEVPALHNLAFTYARLGRAADSLRALEQARAILARGGDPVRLATNRYHTASTMLYHADARAPEAIAMLAEALAAFEAHDETGWAAYTLAALGYALWVAGRHADALAPLRQAYTLQEQLEELGCLPELLAYQGLAHLGLGQPAEALDCTRRAVLALAQGEVSDEVVSEIGYAHAMALAANGATEQAHAEFTRAYESLLAVAAQLADDPARQTFFLHNPTTRRLMQELYARGIARPPAAGVIARRLPLAGGRAVGVTWTVDAGPADNALRQAQGAIALRRARVARLLREAREQGAEPTLAHLAEALGVSPRTVQRDLAYLRQGEA